MRRLIYFAFVLSLTHFESQVEAAGNGNVEKMASIGKSDFSKANLQLVEVLGVKRPNDASEGESTEATEDRAIAPVDPSQLRGFNEWVPFVTRSPDQGEAGSCLYMSTTGLAEMFLARANPNTPVALDGPMDLSERYSMNIASTPRFTQQVRNWRTDTIYIFNNPRSAVMNSSYRFTKGWFFDTASGYVEAPPNAPGAEYGEHFNWVNQSSTVTTGFVDLPAFEREVLFADPAGDQWNVAVAPADLVDRVKEAMVRRGGPVQVIYNHMGYWHAVNIIGFDDDMDSRNCPFVNSFQRSIRRLAEENTRRADAATDPAVAETFRARARRQLRVAARIDAVWQSGGGCQPKGMFYVRDSIYGDQSQPVYTYDAQSPAGSGYYSKPIVLREYDWVRYLANHVQVVYLRDANPRATRPPGSPPQ